MVTRKDRAVAALEAIEDIQQRIDRVAKDVETGKCRFAAIDTWTLAYLLGLDLGSQGVCGMQAGYAIQPDYEDSGHPCPFATYALEFLAPCSIPTRRWKTLESLCSCLEPGEELDEPHVEGSSYLPRLPRTKREKALWARAWRTHKNSPDPDGLFVRRRHDNVVLLLAQLLPEVSREGLDAWASVLTAGGDLPTRQRHDNVVFLLRQLLPKATRQDLIAWAYVLMAGGDLPLTKREEELLASEYGEAHLDVSCSEGHAIVVGWTSVTSTSGAHLGFSVLFGCGGDTEDARGPYDDPRDLSGYVLCETW